MRPVMAVVAVVAVTVMAAVTTAVAVVVAVVIAVAGVFGAARAAVLAAAGDGHRHRAVRARGGVRAGVGGRAADRTAHEGPGQRQQGQRPCGGRASGHFGSMHDDDHGQSGAVARRSTAGMIRRRDKPYQRFDGRNGGTGRICTSVRAPGRAPAPAPAPIAARIRRRKSRPR